MPAVWLECVRVLPTCAGNNARTVIYLVFRDLPLNAPLMDNIRTILSQKAFRDIVISVAATYLLCVFAH